MQLCKGIAVGQERKFETVFLDNGKLSGPLWCIKITQNRECNYLVCLFEVQIEHMRNIQTQENNNIGFWFD